MTPKTGGSTALKTGTDVQLYLLVKTGRGQEVEMTMDSLSGYAGVERLFQADTLDEVVRMVRNLDPDTVVLDRTMFNHRGIETLVPIIRDRRLSVLILPLNNGTQYACLGLDFGSTERKERVKNAIRWAMDEIYT